MKRPPTGPPPELPKALPCPFCGAVPKVELWGNLRTPYVIHGRDKCAASGLITMVAQWNARRFVQLTPPGWHDPLRLD